MAKLLQINSVANTGSTGRIVEQLGQMAQAQGWESHIAYGREKMPSKSHVIKIGTNLDLYVHVLLSRLFDKHGLYSKMSTRRFLRKIDKIAPDVIHLHNIHGYYINYPILLKYIKEKNIPTIITLHDFWLMTGHCAYINQSCDRWKKGCYNCPRLNQYPSAKCDNSKSNWRLKANLFNDFPNIILIPVSNWLERYVKSSLLRNIETRVIQNGIDTEVFKPADLFGTVSEVDWNKFTILTIATRWTDANGYDDIMTLSTLLSDNQQIIMVGLDDKQMKSIPNNIIGFKSTENFQDLKKLYTMADILLNPNREVTFGLVTAEAMACGTPAIVLRNTAGEEIVDASTGFVVDSIQEVPDLIRFYNRDTLQSYSTACRKRILDKFNMEKQFQKYIDLYQTLVKNI